MAEGHRRDDVDAGTPPPSSTVDALLKEVARSPSVRALPVAGQVVGGKYRIERLLGKGGMGAVFAAHHELLQQSVALKVMLAEAADSDQAGVRFLNEARAAARIEGDHVARVLDVGLLPDGAPYIAMELLDGSDLAHLIAARGPLPGPEAVDYVLQALQALAQAHALGIVHRDLKPANLFLARRRDGSQVVKVLDFGISKAIDPLSGMSPSTLTRSSSLLGSPLYMAPEQLRSAKKVDQRADVWAVGVILFELLAGRPPFDGQTLAEVFAAILERQPAALRTFRPDLPAGLEAIVMRCLAREPSQRFANVGELASSLGEFAPAHARPLVERVVRAAPGGGASSPAPAHAEAAASSPPRPGSLSASAAPWSSTNGVARRHRRGPWLAVAGAIALGGAAGSFGVARWVTAHRHPYEPQRAPASSVAPVDPSPVLTAIAQTPSTLDAQREAGAAPQPAASSISPAVIRARPPAVQRPRATTPAAATHDPFDTPR
jgi:serine/threonine-protein kinase